MSGHKKVSIIGTIVVLLFIITAGALALIHKFTPSEKVMPLTAYYPVGQDEVLVIMQDHIYDKKGLFQDNRVYIDYDTVKNTFNKRFYMDSTEGILSYTTPTEVITVALEQLSYYSNGEEKSLEYPIITMKNETVYISIDFVYQYSDMEFAYYSNPNRVVITYDWGDYLYTNVKKATQLRYEPNIKSEILTELAVDDSLSFVDTSETVGNNFSKVMTKDGVIGYVKNSHMNESEYTTLVSKFIPKEYSHISMEDKVNLVWHQVTNQDANNHLMKQLEATKEVNVVSPTWFSLADNDGNITSLADKKYVERAHENGLKVWALIDDFNAEVDKFKLLSSTTKRAYLINQLMNQVQTYDIDGINIDFELIPQNAGEHFIQFIRELSVSCRNEGIVLSVDNYVPASYNAFYDWGEQGVLVDYVIIMAYDEHHSGSMTSGSVSSINFVQNAVTEILNYVPKDRVIMGIPFYTRLWKEETGDDGVVTITSQAYGMQTAENILEQNGVTPVWDDVTGQYYGEYTLDGANYKMWLEEEDSIDMKLKVIAESEVAGIAGWKLGLEKQDIWDIITQYVTE